MAEDDLVGNLTTELFVESLAADGEVTGLDLEQLAECVRWTGGGFSALTQDQALLNSITVISGGIPTRPGKPMNPKPRFTYRCMSSFS